MRQLLTRLDIPVEHEVAIGGLRRRYELHRLWVPREHRAAYAPAVGRRLAAGATGAARRAAARRLTGPPTVW